MLGRGTWELGGDAGQEDGVVRLDRYLGVGREGGRREDMEGTMEGTMEGK